MDTYLHGANRCLTMKLCHFCKYTVGKWRWSEEEINDEKHESTVEEMQNKELIGRVKVWRNKDRQEVRWENKETEMDDWKKDSKID